MTIIQLFIGYYHDIVLCASSDEDRVKQYLKSVRGLSKSEYTLYEVCLSDRECISLYNDVLLEKYRKGVYLTARDIEVIDREAQSEINRFSEMLSALEEYRDISLYAGMEKDFEVSRDAVARIHKSLGKASKIEKLQNAIEENSPIFSKDISTYLRSIAYFTEDHELRELFLTKLNDETE